LCSALAAASPKCHADVPSSVGQPFSAAHFLGHGFGPIPAPGSFACSAFPVPSEHCDLNDRLAVSEASFGRFGVSHKA
jgi:hypothetical protein